MNLTLGCREKVGQEWLYYLMDGTKISKQEWTDLIKKHIRENNNQDKFEKIRKTVNLWNKKDSEEEISLQIYASKYCSNLERTCSTKHIDYREIKDDMGCSQLSFFKEFIMLAHTKEQISHQQRKKLSKEVVLVNNAMNELKSELNIFSENIKDVTPEAINVLLGIQRDLKFGRDRLKMIKK